MKIIITNESETAHFYIRLGFARALAACGHEPILWDLRVKSAFDVFDEHPDMDILVTQTYNVNSALYKCIKSKPWIKVTMKGSDWGIAQQEMDLNKYPILVANQNEIETIIKLYQETGKPDFIDIHYPQKYANRTHSYWVDNGIKVVGLMSGADISDYHGGQFDKNLECDIGYVGGYWKYKSHTINKYLIPLTQYDYRMKVFGNQSWGIPQYCGFIQNEKVKDLFASAKVCPNISEPHSQEYGNDIVERPFKLLSCKSCVVSDYVEGMEEVFRDGLVMAKTPQEFKEKIDYFLKNEDKRIEQAQKGYDIVMNEHTYFHRAAQFFNELNMPNEAQNCLNKYNEILKEIR